MPKEDLKSDITNPEEVSAELKNIGAKLHGPRVAMLRDQPKEKVGSIIVADSYKTEEKLGTIVAIGPEVSINVGLYERLPIPNYDTQKIVLELKDGRLLVLDILHEKDVYFTYPSGASKLETMRGTMKTLYGPPPSGAAKKLYPGIPPTLPPRDSREGGHG